MEIRTFARAQEISATHEAIDAAYHMHPVDEMIYPPADTPATITDCGTTLARYRDALEAGAAPRRSSPGGRPRSRLRRTKRPARRRTS